ncbi:SRPBCC family protein [Sphingomonas sp. AOB5]|uniref:SRPBCC family protein n=1 Tax=Sphingomonas sp. AOB5 TaxID=3034017 RepID=UPI0023F8B77D|nr:SRPBCC family protein [Sphingomonas sp. AOB5]MDF7777593.1 SRPBCC family protein [Sphingomonas sp. AOB5]
MIMTGSDTITAQELRFERLLDAPPETVWGYLTDPELRAMWFMGGEIEPQAGGKIYMTFDHDRLSDGDAPMPEKYAQNRGKKWFETITVWEPPRRLAYSWDNGDAGTVTFDLEPEGADRTRLVLVHSGLRGPQDAKNFGGGWGSHLAVLVKRIRGEHVENFWTLHAEAEAKAAAALD